MAPDGALRWSRPGPIDRSIDAAVEANDAIVVAATARRTGEVDRRTVRSFDATTGRARWITLDPLRE